MLRVLTLSTLYPDASRPRFAPFVARQTEGLAAHPEVEVQVLAPVGVPPFAGWHPRYRALAGLPSSESWNGVPVHRPRFAHLPGTGGRFDAALLARALLPMLDGVRRTFPFDVIDAEFFFPDGPAAARLGRGLGVPVSIKARGSDIHFWGRQAGTGRQIVEAGCTADSLLAVSAALKADMVALGMPEGRIAVHRTGIDRDVFGVRDRAQAKRMLDLKGPLLVAVGALIPRKRHHLAVEALALLPGTTLVVIGEGPERARLEALAARLGVRDRLRLLGNQTHAIIADWLGAADALVLVSQAEGLANAWVEALASGTPVVIGDAGGAGELLDRPEAGVIVAPDAAAVAEGIRSVLARDADREAVAATVAAYGWDANTAQLYDHLKAVAARR